MDELDETLTPHPRSALRTSWAQGGKLTTGSKQGISCQGQFSGGSPFSVQLDVDAGDLVVFAQAIVEFTTGGNSITRTIDVAGGATISGVAEAVKVRILDVTPGSFPSGQDYNATISIAARPRPTTAVPPIQLGLAATEIATTASAQADVPQGASSVAIYGDLDAGGPASLRLTQVTADGSTVLVRTAVHLGGFVPLVAGAGIAKVTNESGSTASVSIVFGIDG